MASKPEHTKRGHTKGGPPSGEPAKATTPRIFVGNLSWDTNKEGLRTYMETAGKVNNCDILLDHLGRSKGGAIVEFESVDMAQTAIDKLNDTTLDGRLIFVREDREPEKPTTPTAVFVSNLPFRATWQDLKEFFAEAGTVVRADTHSYPGGKSKGTGIVTFASPEGATAAIAMAGKEFQGRAIGVREFIVYPKKQQQQQQQPAQQPQQQTPKEEEQ